MNITGNADKEMDLTFEAVITDCGFEGDSDVPGGKKWLGLEITDLWIRCGKIDITEIVSKRYTEIIETHILDTAYTNLRYSMPESLRHDLNRDT